MFRPNQWTVRLMTLLLDIAKSAEREKKEYYITGGFAIDLSLGRLTRNHEDIDFNPHEKDGEYWKKWFIGKGFKINRSEILNNYPLAYFVDDSDGKHVADVWPFLPNGKGEITMLNNDGNHGVWKGKYWSEVSKVIYESVPIFIENLQSIIEQKFEYSRRHNEPLSPKHQHDVEIYNLHIR